MPSKGEVNLSLLDVWRRMDTELIQRELAVYLDSIGHKLYQVSYDTIEGEAVLHVEIDESLDLEAISELSRKISDFIDTKDYGDTAYLLDVATVGLEKVLCDFAAVKEASGKYVHVCFKKATAGLKEVEGYLEVDGEDMKITYRDKSRTKSLSCTYQDIKHIRLAIDLKGVKK